MNNIPDNLKRLGYDEWFQANRDTEKPADLEIARVVSVHRDSYVITRGDKDLFAEPAGRLIYSAASPLDLPTTGDWVYAHFYDEDTHAIIHHILPRRTLLKRKTAGKNIEFQLIAANIDIAFIIQSLDANFNLRRLERYLVMVNESRILPIVLLSKCDLMDESEIAEKTALIKKIMPGVTALAFSNQSGRGLDKIRELLLFGQTSCLIGSSGVGKTTLLSSLAGGRHFETNPVREKDSKGRHTTTHRQMIQLDCGAMLIDTPGMRELGNMSVDSGLDETFPEIMELSRQCRFGDCTHVNEKGCAVLNAVKEGLLPEKRYENYINMKKESSYNEMSYLEKRRKDKKFAKYCKSVMKQKKER